MATVVTAGFGLYEALLEEGFELPEECGDVELVMPVDGVMQLRYTVLLTGPKLAQLGRALTTLGDRTLPLPKEDL